MILISLQLVHAVSFATLNSDIMLNSEMSNRIKLTIIKTGESIELDQRRVQIRENKNGLMALSYVAPIFEAMGLEDFFDNIDSSGKLTMNIGGTGDVNVNFRGIVEGREKNFSKNIDHKILLLEEPKCHRSAEYVPIKRSSTFRPRGKISK